MQITYQSIGRVHSPYKSLDGIPRQSRESKGIHGEVEVYPEYVAGLESLEGFSHILLLCHFHSSKVYDLQFIPRNRPPEGKKRGLFATRSPNRPNPIGLSLVRLLAVDGDRLIIEGLDILDGTPLLDIKPYVGEYGNLSDVRLGWLDGSD